MAFKEELEADESKKNMINLNQLYVRFIKCSMISMRKQDKIRSHIEIVKTGIEIIKISTIEEVIVQYFESCLLEVLEGKCALT